MEGDCLLAIRRCRLWHIFTVTDIFHLSFETSCLNLLVLSKSCREHCLNTLNCIEIAHLDHVIIKGCLCSFKELLRHVQVGVCPRQIREQELKVCFGDSEIDLVSLTGWVVRKLG